MTQEEAQRMLQRVHDEVPQIRATIDASKPGKDGTGYRVRLELRGFVLYAHRAEDLDAIKEVWQYYYLPEDQWVMPKREDKVRYLVDGIPMTITQGKDGYWRATYQQEGKTHKMYWGKDDPRGRYPLFSEREAV